MAWNPEADSVVVPSKSKWNPEADSTIRQTAPGEFQGEAKVSPWGAFWSGLRKGTEDVFPNVVKQAKEGSTVPLWAGLRDAATLIPRFAAGVGAGAGELAGSRDVAEAAKAFSSTLRSPVQESQTYTTDVLPTAEKYGLNPQLYAGMAEDPLLMGASAVGGGPFQAGVKLATGNLLRRAADYATGIGDLGPSVNAGGKDYAIPGAGEITPLVIGGLGEAASAAIPGTVAWMRQKAGRLVTKVGKPQITKNNPDIVERGEDWLVNQGNLPKVVGPMSRNAGQIYERYAPLVKQAIRDVYEAKAAADKTGVKINMNKAVEAGERNLDAKVASKEAMLTDEQIAGTKDWLRKIALRPDSPEMAKALADAEIPYKGRMVPLIGQKDIYVDVRGEPIMESQKGVKGIGTNTEMRRIPVLDEKGNQVLDANLQPKYNLAEVALDKGPSVGSGSAQAIGGDLSPLYETAKRLIGQKPFIEGYQQLPDYYPPRPDIEVRPSSAHNAKKTLQKLVYEDQQAAATTPKAARQAVAKGAESDIRQQLAEKAPVLSAADRRAAPIFDVRDYFSYFPRRGNVNAGTPWGTAWRIGQTGGARQLWNAADVLRASPDAIQALPQAISILPRSRKK